MSDKNKTKAELTAEISALRKRLSVLEKDGDERRQYHQRMQKSEDRYVTLVEQSRDAIYLIYDRKFEYVNHRFEELFGYKKEELYQPDFDVMKIFMPQDRELATKVLEKLYKIEPIRPQYEFTGITKDNRQIEIELSVAFVPYKAGMAIQGIVRDITERKKAEKRLIKSEALYRELADNLGEYIIAVDMEGNVIYVNNPACKISGYSKDEALKINVADVLPKEYLPLMMEKMAQRRAGDRSVIPYEVDFINKQGKRLFFEISSTLITEANKPRGVLLLGRDITARKQIEISLKDSEEKFRQFAELLPGMAFECDRNFMITFINKRALQTFLYTDEDIAAGKCILDVVAPEWLEFVLQHAAKVLTGVEIHSLEVVAVRKDGSRLPMQISVAPIHDGGNIIGLRGLVFDMTEHKLREAALRQSEERYRSIIETIEDGYFEFDLRGSFTFFNEACRKLVRYSSGEMIGLNFSQFTNKETAEKLRSVARKVYDTGQPEKSSDMEVVTKDAKDGFRNHLEISMSLIRDADRKPIGFRGIARDITERKKMENELRESREIFKNMVANVPGIIYRSVVKKDGTITFPYFSERVAQLGVDPSLIIENPSKIFDFVEDEYKDKLLISVWEAITSCSRWIWEGPANINNKRHWLRCVAQPLPLDNGEILFDGLILDLTESKQVEEEKKELEARLQQAQKMEAVGTLAGGIAHDFNNLLMGIQGYTSLMLLDADPAHSHFRKLKSVEQLVTSGADLTKQLLGFARRGRYEIKPININDLIDKTTTLFGRTKKEIAIHRLLEKDIWAVEVDQGQIEQVLLNLYVNAWQAMPGGGDMYLETKNMIVAEDEIKQYSLPGGNYVKISITDTGVGMDEATRERIFEPFFTTKEMGRGTGLGLATVYGIIKGHNGVINVYSEKGHGTTFSIYLPASDKEVSADRQPDMSLIKGKETVLLVDDEVAVIDVTKELLEALGYKVTGVQGGADAVAIYRDRQKDIDIIILDMIMPGMSGSETFDALKMINPQVKVILSSGYSINGEATEIMEKGCLAFIQKPFNLAGISKKIREALDEK